MLRKALYKLLFCYIVTFCFSCICYLLNTLKSTLHTKLSECFLQVFVHVTRNTVDTMILYINFLKPIFANSMFNTFLHDYVTTTSQIDFVFYIGLV